MKWCSDIKKGDFSFSYSWNYPDLPILQKTWQYGSTLLTANNHNNPNLMIPHIPMNHVKNPRNPNTATMIMPTEHTISQPILIIPTKTPITKVKPKQKQVERSRARTKAKINQKLEMWKRKNEVRQVGDDKMDNPPTIC